AARPASARGDFLEQPDRLAGAAERPVEDLRGAEIDLRILEPALLREHVDLELLFDLDTARRSLSPLPLLGELVEEPGVGLLGPGVDLHRLLQVLERAVGHRRLA